MRAEEIRLRKQIDAIQYALFDIYAVANSDVSDDAREDTYRASANALLDAMPDVDVIIIDDKEYGEGEMKYTLDEVRDHLDTLKGKLEKM